MPGPAGDPNARRRNVRVGVVVLPAAGRKGRTPKWPLPDNAALMGAINQIAAEVAALEEKDLLEGKLSRSDATKWTRARQRLAVAEAKLEASREAEQAIWKELWRTPQATQWEKLRWTRDVAHYARLKALGEVGDLDSAKESRQMSDRLGLSPKSLRMLMWVIADVDQAHVGPVTSRPPSGPGSGGRKRGGRHLAAVDDPDATDDDAAAETG